jgi:hypothetical protein
MWNAVLIPHMVIDSVVTILFLFQIAMLAVSMSTEIPIIVTGSCSKDIHAKDNQQRSSRRRYVEKCLKQS